MHVFSLVLLVLLLVTTPNLEAKDCSRSWSYSSSYFASTRADKALEYLPSPVKPVIVAIVDTGADITHPAIRDQLWVNKKEIPNNGIDDDKNGFIDDINGFDFYHEKGGFLTETSGISHGTHIAGIIASRPWNGICGIATDYADLMILNFNKPSPRASSAFVRDREALAQNVALAIRYAVDNGASIINLSINGPQPVQIEKDAITYANTKGVLVVTSAGNDNKDNDKMPSYPADYNLPNIISVAAIDTDGRIPYFSNTGAKSVDILAPGVSIASTIMNGGIIELNGTSQAAPHVAGALALLKVKNPSWGAQELKAHLLSSVTPNPYYKGKVKQAGNLNLLTALQTPSKDTQPIFDSKDIATDNFTDAEGNFIKDVSCLLCGSRILCGNIDIKVKEVNREEETSLKSVCEKRNLTYLTKENANSLNDSEIGFFSLRSEIYAMTPTVEGKQNLITNGFLLSDLIRQLGFTSYNKLRSIHFLVPALSTSDYSKYSNQTESLDYYYPQYLQDLINTPSPLLEHKGNGYFITSTNPSPAIIDRMTRLLPINDTITYNANVNLQSLSIYKVGGQKSKKSDKPLVEKLTKELELPKINDLKEARKQIYLKLNEHHLADKDVKILIPKKYQNNPELIKHYKELLSSPTTIVSSGGAGPSRRGADGGGSRSSGGGSSSSSSPTTSTQNASTQGKAVIGSLDPRVERVQRQQVERSQTTQRNIEKTSLYRESKTASDRSSRLLETPTVQRLSGDTDSSQWARRYPEYRVAVKENNPTYFKRNVETSTSTARVERIRPITQKRGIASPSMPLVMPTSQARSSSRGSELASSSPPRQVVVGNAPVRANSAPTISTQVTTPPVPQKAQSVVAAQAAPQQKSQVVAAVASEAAPATTPRRRRGSTFTDKIKCSHENWNEFLTQVVGYNSPRHMSDKSCVQNYNENFYCKAVTGEDQRKYNEECMAEGLEQTSCAQIAFDETAKLCKTYIDFGREHLTIEDLDNCYAALSTFICNSSSCDGEVSTQNDDLIRALSSNSLDGYLNRRVQLKSTTSNLSTFMPHDKTFNLFLGDKYEVASWNNDQKKTRIATNQETLNRTYEKISTFNKLFPKRACQRINSGTGRSHAGSY